MLLKVLFILLLLYLASRAIGNLLRAVLHDPRGGERIGPGGDGERRAHHTPPAAPRRRRYEAPIEDARWVDVGGKDE